MNVETQPIVVEQTFDAPLAVVWRAITEQSQMTQWFFEPIADFEPRVGFETKFTVRAAGQDYEHLWKILEVTPQQRIVYDWRYTGIPGESTVTWELSEASGGTTLKLTHSGTETFPQDNPLFQREAGVAGWSYFVGESLKGFLEEEGVE